METTPPFEGPDTHAQVQALKWKVGCELPPFTACNTAAVKMVLNLVNGAVDHVPSISVSAAVAVQIHRLFFDSEAHHEDPYSTPRSLTLASFTISKFCSPGRPTELTK